MCEHSLHTHTQTDGGEAPPAGEGGSRQPGLGMLIGYSPLAGETGHLMHDLLQGVSAVLAASSLLQLVGVCTIPTGSVCSTRGIFTAAASGGMHHSHRECLQYSRHLHCCS